MANEETLNEVFMKHNGGILAFLALLIFSAAVPSVFGQTVQPPPATPEPQHGASGGDPIRQLNLTPEQREQIRSIREANKTERAAINERVRDANHALEEALDTDNPDEAVVEQRMRELGAAQAAAMRMRILTEVRIRKVLTPEQLGILRTLRQQARQVDRGRLRNERQQQRRQAIDGARGLQNQRNDIGPLMRRRNLQPTTRP